MLKPNKHQGQHWLISKKYLEKIVESAQINPVRSGTSNGVKPGEIILEVGPGTGNLTRALLDSGISGIKVIAIEKDKRLFELLISNFQFPISKQKLKIVAGDILEFDENTIKQPYRIVANIPYYLTGQLIQKFLLSSSPPADMILMVQKEVGERLCAQPPRANYLSSLVQSFAETKILFKVSKENFWPKPKVDSVVIKITPHQHYYQIRRSPNLVVSGLESKSKLENLENKKNARDDPQEFIKFLRIVFRQPRQTLANNLKRGQVPQEKIETVFTKLKIPKNTRPQNLSVETLTKIFETTKI